MIGIVSIFDRWVTQVTDGARLGAFQVNSFEVTVVGAYFAIMAVLSIYGLHRYQLVYLYHRHHKRSIRQPRERFEALPRVTVQLPIFNEQYVVEQLLESVSRLDYPRDRLQIQVLDDSTDDTRLLARSAVERLAAQGHPIEYLHRDHRLGYKAGALQAGLQAASGELIAIFDADFAPRPDFLHQTVHHFTDRRVGAVQARWTYRNRNQSVLTRLQAMLLDAHFVFEHGGRARSGRFFNFNGTAGVLRRSMIEDAGGWQHDTLTEDTDLSYRAQMKGWRFLYLPQVEVPSELPADMVSFQVQQARWAKGLIQTGKKILPTLLRSDLPGAVKAEACFHLTANLSYPLMVLLFMLLLPAMVVRFQHWNGQLLYLDLPLFLGTFSSLSTFYLLAQKELFPDRWFRKVLLLPLLVAVGVGLTITNCIAVLEALLGVQSPFQRTAKYSSDSARAWLARRKYRRRGGWLPVANLMAGTYVVGCVGFSLQLENWAAMPFLALFILGYYFTGCMMLYQSRGQRLSERMPLQEEPARSPLGRG